MAIFKEIYFTKPKNPTYAKENILHQYLFI